MNTNKMVSAIVRPEKKQKKEKIKRKTLINKTNQKSLDSEIENTVKVLKTKSESIEQIEYNKALDKFSKVNYFKESKYENKNYEAEEKKPTIEKDCWQVGVDFDPKAMFFFFPKKEKKITGQMMDKGIMLMYINAQPALCYF